MLRALVVEDEKLEREALTKLIREHFKDRIEQVTAVTNGQQALDLFGHERYDLVFTDINMPKLTGLDFLRSLKKLHPDVKAVIVTGYDYFHYAQEALRIGVEDFILKPCTEKEICSCIEQILYRMEYDIHHNFNDSAGIKEMQALLQRDLLYAILYHEGAQSIKRYFDIFHLNVASGVCICLDRKTVSDKQLEQLRSTLQQEFLSCFSEPYFEYYVLYVFHDILLCGSDIESIKTTVQTVLGSNQNIRIGGVKNAVDEFYDSYVEARNGTILLKTEGLCHQRESYCLSVDAICNGIIESMTDGSLSIDQLIAIEFRKLCLGMNKQQLHDILNYFFTALCERMKQDSDMQEYKYVIEYGLNNVSRVSNIENAYELLLYTLKESLEPIIERKRIKMNKLIAMSYQFIEQHYHEFIGLNDLANYLDVTPQYISSLLSQHTKNSFTNILAEYRIAQAKVLLVGNKKIKEIAATVGFQNQNYFAKTFKKITGFTPNEYKSLYQLAPDADRQV